MKRTIITDSGSDLNDKITNSDDIKVAPFNLQIGDEIFIDDINLNKSNYMGKMETSKNTPMSSAPSPEHYYNVYKDADQAFAITISAKMSGSYNSAISAKNMILDEFKNKSIHVFDSKSASAGQTLVTLKVKEFINNGLDFETIIEKTNEFIGEMRTYFYIQNFDNLVKTGRTNAYIASIAKILNISIIGTEKDGEIELIEKTRGQKKSLAKLANFAKEANINFSEKILSISYVDTPEEAQELKQAILKVAPFKDVIIQETSCLCTNYASSSGLVIAF